MEYSFQFKPVDDSIKLLSLKEVAGDECSDMDLVNISAKIISIEEMQIVGKDKLKLANTLISDGTETMILELWEEQTSVATEAETYSMEKVRVRVRNGAKRLGTTKETVMHKIVDARLENVSCDKEETNKLASTKCIKIDNINSIEKLKSFKCVNCNKRLIQASAGLIVHCDKCDNTMRSSICEDGIWAKVVVSVNGENVHLVLFENTLRPFYEGKDPNLELLLQTLLLQDNLEITFNSETKIMSTIRSAPME